MSIATYAELQSAIADWAARSDLSTPAPDLIRLCESMLNYGHGEPGEQFYVPPLRVRQMEARTTFTADSEYESIPVNDFLEVRYLKANTSPETDVKYVTPAQFNEAASSYSSGTPKVYTIVGNEFRFGPAPSAVTMELGYVQKIPALSDSNTTNWLLAANPNVYLYGALFQGALYTKDDAEVAKFLGLFSGAVRALVAQDRRAKFGGAPLVMRPVTGTP